MNRKIKWTNEGPSFLFFFLLKKEELVEQELYTSDFTLSAICPKAVCSCSGPRPVRLYILYFALLRIKYIISSPPPALSGRNTHQLLVSTAGANALVKSPLVTLLPAFEILKLEHIPYLYLEPQKKKTLLFNLGYNRFPNKFTPFSLYFSFHFLIIEINK